MIRLLLLAPLLLAACSRAPLPVVPKAAAAPRALAATTVATLAAHAEDPAWEGRRVAFPAAFRRATFVLAGDRTARGYELVAGSAAVLCANLYTASGAYPGAPADASQDLAAALAARLLAPDTTAALTGRFHVARRYASHSGIATFPAAVELLAIDGEPVAGLRRGS